MSEDKETLRARLNAETGRVKWGELERHFARGATVAVAADLDLVEVAACFIQDDKATVEKWLSSGQVRPTTAEDAQGWAARDPDLWAVVAAPWVLIQEP